MGANDSCNDWGPAVGAGTVKLWQAYILSGILNVLGAILLGESSLKNWEDLIDHAPEKNRLTGQSAGMIPQREGRETRSERRDFLVEFDRSLSLAPLK